MGKELEVSNGSEVVMRLSHAAYGALYQTKLLDLVLNYAKDGDLATAANVVVDALALANSLDCPWCDRLGLHDDCWTPRVRDARGA
jgi:hypothetical protein